MKKLIAASALCLASCLSTPLSQEHVRQELALLAGDADAIAMAFETTRPEFADHMELLSDVLESLSDGGVTPAGIRAAREVLLMVLEKAEVIADEEVSAYAAAVDILLRRLLAQIQE